VGQAAPTLLPQGLKLVNTEGCGEVQTPVKLPQGFHPVPGDPIVFRHPKPGNRPNVSTNTFWWKKIKSWTALRPTAGLGSVSFRSCLNIALWPNLFVRVDFQVLEIPQYSCALKIDSSSTLAHNPNFETTSWNLDKNGLGVTPRGRNLIDAYLSPPICWAVDTVENHPDKLDTLYPITSIGFGPVYPGAVWPE
jgi:hypothetical protein